MWHVHGKWIGGIPACSQLKTQPCTVVTVTSKCLAAGFGSEHKAGAGVECLGKGQRCVLWVVLSSWSLPLQFTHWSFSFRWCCQNPWVSSRVVHQQHKHYENTFGWKKEGTVFWFFLKKYLFLELSMLRWLSLWKTAAVMCLYCQFPLCSADFYLGFASLICPAVCAHILSLPYEHCTVQLVKQQSDIPVSSHQPCQPSSLWISCLLLSSLRVPAWPGFPMFLALLLLILAASRDQASQASGTWGNAR